MNPINAHGWKTYLAVVAMILTGVVAIVNGSTSEGVTAILAGLALLGIGGKLTKIIQAAQK